MIAVKPYTMSRNSCRVSLRHCGIVAVLLSSLHLGGTRLLGQPLQPEVPPRIIGATATVTESRSGLPFQARVDTGATTCSIHCEAMEIPDEADDPRKNVGKKIRFLVKNKRGQSEWLDAKIVACAIVRTSEKSDWRYKVKLGLRWNDVEKDVLVTLNDRKQMQYPVLIGRNFLRDDFLVNVAWDGGNAAEKLAQANASEPVNDAVAVDLVVSNDTPEKP